MASGNGSKPPTPTFPYTWISDAQLDLNARYLVKGLIEPAGFGLIFGPSGSGKSFFTADIAQHIATGQQWRGKKVNQALVVYIASEAGASIIRRFIAWRDNALSESTESIPLAILTRSPNLIGGTDGEKLKEQLSHMQDEAKLPLGLVVFDTLSRAIPGGDENNAEDMTSVIGHADDLRDTFKCGTTFVHHSGKNVDAGARGHSSLFAAADLVIRVSDRLGVVEKVRDGVSGETFPFSLQPVDLGVDADGDEVTSCLLSHDGSDIPKQPNLKGIGKNQRLVLEYLRPLIRETGQKSSGTSVVPANVLVASFDALCDRMQPLYPTLKPWQVKKKVNEAVLGLQASGHAAMHNDSVWLRTTAGT